jgi:flagellar protein FliS
MLSATSKHLIVWTQTGNFNRISMLQNSHDLQKDNMPSNTASAATLYQHNQVTNADPVQLIILLYNGALFRIAQGRQRLQEGNPLHTGLAISKAQAIVGELRQSLNLDLGGDIAKNLDRLYAYLHELMVTAMVENRAEPLDEAAKLLTELRGAWGEVATLATPIWEKNQAAASTGRTGEPREPIRMQMSA